MKKLFSILFAIVFLLFFASLFSQKTLATLHTYSTTSTPECLTNLSASDKHLFTDALDTCNKDKTVTNCTGSISCNTPCPKATEDNPCGMDTTKYYCNCTTTVTTGTAPAPAVVTCTSLGGDYCSSPTGGGCAAGETEKPGATNCAGGRCCKYNCPAICAANNRACGTVGSCGCGPGTPSTTNTGVCPSPQTCTHIAADGSYLCRTTSTVCTPKTCAQLSPKCGSAVPDGCTGTKNCNSNCASTQTCSSSTNGTCENKTTAPTCTCPASSGSCTTTKSVKCSNGTTKKMSCPVACPTTKTTTTTGQAKLTIHVAGNVTSAVFHSLSHSIGNCNVRSGVNGTNFTVSGSRICSGTTIGDSGNTTSIVPNTSGVTWTINSKSSGSTLTASGTSLKIYIPGGGTADVTAHYGAATTPGPITPTPETTGTSTTVSLVVGLDGVGKTGDQVNKTAVPSDSIVAPAVTTTNATVEVLDNKGVSKGSGTGQLTYDDTSTDPNYGLFTGDIDLDHAITPGNYSVKVTVDNHLSDTINNKAIAATGTIITVANVEAGDVFGAADATPDDHLLPSDYYVIANCAGFTIDNQVACTGDLLGKADLNLDGNVDEFDYNLFLREYSVRQDGN